MLHIERYIDTDDIIDLEKNKDSISDAEKVKLIARVTIDRRLNSKDLKVYSYLLNFRDEGFTQERISDALDLTRANVNRSIAKLTAFNYIEKNKSSKKESLGYIIKGYESAGIINYNAHDIIKAVNVMEKVKNEDKMFYMDEADFYATEESIKELELNLEENSRHMIIDEYNKESLRLGDMKKSIKDIIDIKQMMSDLDNTIFKSSSLDKAQVSIALNNKNKRLVLLLAYSTEKRIVKFREKYLESYIKFLCKFTKDLQCEFFFQAFYETLELNEFTLEDLMKICGITHRDAPPRKKLMRDRIVESLEDLKGNMKAINALNHREALEEENPFSDELISKIKSLDTKKTRFTFEEFALCIIALKEESRFMDSTNMPFERLVQIKSDIIFDCMNKLRYYRSRYSEEIEKIKREK